MRYAAAPKRRASPPRSATVSAALVAMAVLAAAALCVVMLFMRARASALDAECADLAARIEELRDERARARIELESIFTLAELEDIAVNELGMRPKVESVPYSEYFAPGA